MSLAIRRFQCRWAGGCFSSGILLWCCARRHRGPSHNKDLQEMVRCSYNSLYIIFMLRASRSRKNIGNAKGRNSLLGSKRCVSFSMASAMISLSHTPIIMYISKYTWTTSDCHLPMIILSTLFSRRVMYTTTLSSLLYSPSNHSYSELLFLQRRGSHLATGRWIASDGRTCPNSLRVCARESVYMRERET